MSARAEQTNATGVPLLDSPSQSAPQLRLGLLLQVDAIPYRGTSEDELDPSTSAPLNQEQFLVRRGRPRLVLESKYVGASFMIDGNTVAGGSVRVLEAEMLARIFAPDGTPPVSSVGASPPSSRFSADHGHTATGEAVAVPPVPYLAAGAGLFRTPFGFELQQQARQRLFLERGNGARALFGSSFDLGARLFGGVRFLRYSLAVMNGSPIGSGNYEYRDLTSNKDVVSRLGVEAPIGSSVHLAAGVSLLGGHGASPGTKPTKPGMQWRDDNENGVVDPAELIAVPAVAQRATESFTRSALGADLRVFVDVPVLGELTFLSEIIRGTNLDRAYLRSDPIVAGRTLRQLALQVGVSQELTRWAAVGVRYDTYDADADATESGPAGPIAVRRTWSTWALTAAFRMAPLRVLAEVDLQQNPLGRDASGNPTSVRDDMVTLRGEVAF
jgi:hypothetical protein